MWFRNPITVSLPAATPPYTTAWLYAYSTTSNTTPYTTTGTSAFWPSTSTGGITVTNDTNTIADPTKDTGAVVALISYGKNGYGAANTKGGVNDSSAAGTDEIQNINPIAGILPNTVVKRDTTDSTSGGGAFDDVVMILSANDLTGLLIANGKLQTNAQAALSQANAIILGYIMASRFHNPSGPCSDDYYYNTPSGSPSFPSTVSAWGIKYQQVTSVIGNCTSPANAYTLTAGDGTQKIVTTQELIGILSLAAGFI